MNKIFKQLAVSIALIIILVMPYLVFAQSETAPETAALGKLKDVATGAGGYAAADQYTVSEISGMVVNIFLSLLGIIFVILLILAGHNWMTASGDEAKVTKAKETLLRAAIGLIIVIGAFAIWNFVFTRLIGGIVID